LFVFANKQYAVIDVVMATTDMKKIVRLNGMNFRNQKEQTQKLNDIPTTYISRFANSTSSSNKGTNSSRIPGIINMNKGFQISAATNSDSTMINLMIEFFAMAISGSLIL